MNAEKIINVFDKLLDQWYQAEETVIHEFSGDFDESYEALDKEREEYKTEFFKALNEKSPSRL